MTEANRGAKKTMAGNGLPDGLLGRHLVWRGAQWDVLKNSPARPAHFCGNRSGCFGRLF
jgi:hypothetical protein